MNEELHDKRHTLAHILASIVLENYPDALPTIGPAIDNGFYYDFDNLKIGDKDLAILQKKMRKTLSNWTDWERREISPKEAREHFKNNPYKLELINEIEAAGEQITLYTCGNFTDLCRGGHTDNPSADIDPKAFVLDRVAGAYWRGDENNTMLTRIYGLAFDTPEELKRYQEQQAEAKERDHKKLGRELGLFTFSETVGKGLPLWTDKGSVIRRELERFIVDEEIKRGYKHVYTPDVAKIDLYKKSGHYPYYQDSMYAPIDIDDDQFMLRPMTCPHHFELYSSEKHSYKELPLRIGELAKLYRYEQSGELSGLQRVRSFCLADAHIICADAAQAGSEVNEALDLIEYMSNIFGLTLGENYWYRLSLGDRGDTEKYFDDANAWDEAESILRDVLTKRNVPFVEAEQEAAFYGPKIDVQMKNVNGKEDTAFTVQYDFVMPKRFELRYVAADGTEQEPVVVHRSSIGAIERVIAFLIEHFGGAFPLWLSPNQVSIFPIADAHHNFAQQVAELLTTHNIRIDLDDSNTGLGKKIRNWKLNKSPYAVIIGDDEIKDNTVTLEHRSGSKETLSLDALLTKLAEEINSKTIL